MGRNRYLRCALPHCKGVLFEINHRFPRSPARCELWLKALDDPVLNATAYVQLQHIAICCRHFRVDDYVHPESRRLNSALAPVPSLNLKALNELDKCRHGKTLPSKDANSPISQKNNSDDSNASSASFAIPENTKQLNLSLSSKQISKESFLGNDRIFSTEMDRQEPEFLLNNFTDASDEYKIVVSDGFIQIIDTLLGNEVAVDILWLRYKCICQQCFDEKKARPKLNFLEIDDNLQPLMAYIIEETRKLDIIWSDGHTSSYFLQQLYEDMQQEQSTRQIHTALLWNFEHTQHRDDLHSIDWYYLIKSKENACHKALDRLRKYGVLIIDQIPKCNKDSLLKHTIITKLFNLSWNRFITETRKTFPQHYMNTPISNLTYESMDKGLQILTIPNSKDHLKLQLNLVDGFHAIEQLPKETFDFLTDYKVVYSFTNDNGVNYTVKHPVILKNQSVERVWFSTTNMEHINSQDFRQISKHCRQLNKVMQMEQNQWPVELNAETIVILDNYRICWCLKEPPIGCELDCIYMERKDYLSSLNILRRDSSACHKL